MQSIIHLAKRMFSRRAPERHVTSPEVAEELSRIVSELGGDYELVSIIHMLASENDRKQFDCTDTEILEELRSYKPRGSLANRGENLSGWPQVVSLVGYARQILRSPNCVTSCALHVALGPFESVETFEPHPEGPSKEEPFDK